MVLGVLTGWLDRREREAIAYLVEENRLLRRQFGGRRLRFTDEDRRRLVARAYRVGRAALREIATIRDAGHLAAVASSADRPEMDVREETRTARCAVRDPSSRRPDGDGESDMGLHADPGRARERRSSRGPLDHSADPESGGVARLRHSARPHGRHFSARIGARLPAPISSRRKSGRGEAWLRTTPRSKSIWPPAASRSSDPRHIPRHCSGSRSCGR